MPCLGQMEESTPAQAALCLPLLVPKLAEVALEVRAGTVAVLREIGGRIASPVIKTLAQDFVTALAEPTNQKHPQGVSANVGNQAFLSWIDLASLSFLVLVIVRGLKGRNSVSKQCK